MTIAPRRQIACHTDLAAILVLVDPCQKGVPRPSLALPSGRTAQLPSRSGPSASKVRRMPDAHGRLLLPLWLN
jgi:hypothetical protein